jgi:hypothetical protein
LAVLLEACQEVSSSEEYRGIIDSGRVGDDRPGIVVTEGPLSDINLVGVPALGYISSRTFLTYDNDDGKSYPFERLVRSDDYDNDGTNARVNPKVVICGGKGGVRKTIAMSLLGHKVALVSSDPVDTLREQ